jgi:hypothetical protein
MATQLTFRRGTSEPTQASGLTLGEPAFNTSLSTFHIGRGAGVTAAWVGAQISGLSTGIAAGLTLQVPTMSAVKDYVASTTSGVATLNSLTGTVTLAAGTNIGVTTAGSSITVTNLGVQTFNGLTGAVGGVTTSAANTFTALNTFNAGISAAGGVTFAGDIAVNGGDITTSSATATVFNTTTTNLSIGSAATTLTMGATSGTASIRNSNIILGTSSSTFIATPVSTNNDLYISPYGNLLLAPSSSSVGDGTYASVVVTNSTDAAGQVQIAGGDLYLGTKSVDGAVFTSVNVIFEGSGNADSNKTTVTVDNPTANRTITLPNASGTVALTSQLMGAVNGSTAATNAVTSFNGLTGAVTGASLGANTFTGLNTFNSGITTSFIYVSTGSTFGARVDVAGILDVVGGVTMESTSDHAGAARFASTLVSTGSITANGGLTASTLDVSGTARTTGNMTVGATLTVTGNLLVNGTTTTINSTTLSVDDKNIVLADGNVLDASADGGGITLKGATDKTFNWVDGTDSWTSSEHMDLAATKVFKIGTSTVLSSSALGSGVTGSSLTAVGTLATGVWQATAIGATYGGTGLTSYTIGDVIYANGTSSLAKLTTTTAGYLLAANGAGAAPEYKQVLIKDAAANSIATILSGSGTLTATIQNATSSLKGVASFDNTNFTVSTGAVTITGVDGGTY